MSRCEIAVLQIKMKMGQLVLQLMIRLRSLRGSMGLKDNRLLIRLLLNSQRVITARSTSAHLVSSTNLNRFLKLLNRKPRSPILQFQIRNITFHNIQMINLMIEMTANNPNPNRMEQKIYLIYKLWI